jgi:hypothetical protein
MNESDTIRIEGFAESLKSYRVYCVGTSVNLPQVVRSRIACIDTEVGYRGRKILCVQDGSPYMQWLIRMKWDAFFVIKDATDMRLALTYIVSGQKPLRVVWAGGEPSNAFISQIEKHDQISIIGFSTTPPQYTYWNAIFWSHDVLVEELESPLQMRLGASTLAKYNLRSVLKEIKASEVGLVWSSIRESDKHGSLYWFDPNEGITQESLYSLKDAADILRTVADSIGAMK